MTAITVTNTDWALLSAVKTALAEATVDDEADEAEEDGQVSLETAEV